MSDMEMEQFTVRILDRDYRLSCAPEEKAGLLAAVEHVDRQMQAVRHDGKVTNTERVAVFAALSIANELLTRTTTAKRAAEPSTKSRSVAVADPEIARRMRDINSLLDTALAKQDQLF
jgi:cell division protein ZapA